MYMPQADRKKIYEALFDSGVFIAKKDYNLASHPEIKAVKNLYVIKAIKSLVSRGLVKEQYAWRHYYFFLLPDGVTYLREYLHLSDDIQPSSYVPGGNKKDAEKDGFKGVSMPSTDRGGYRAMSDSVDKVTAAGPGSAPIGSHRAGFGRGAPPPAQ